MLIPKTRLLFDKNGKAVDRLGLVEWEDLPPVSTNLVSSPFGPKFKALNVTNNDFKLCLKSGNTIDMNLSNGFTWSVWVNKKSTRHKGVVLGNLNTILLYFEPLSLSGDRLGLYGLNNNVNFIPTTFEIYKWNWCVYSTSTSREKFFLNGEQIWSNPVSPNRLTSLNDVKFGRDTGFTLCHYDNGDGNNFYVGSIFDFVMFEGAIDNLDTITRLKMPKGYVNHITDADLEVGDLTDGGLKLY